MDTYIERFDLQIYWGDWRDPGEYWITVSIAFWKPYIGVRFLPLYVSLGWQAEGAGFTCRNWGKIRAELDKKLTQLD